MSRLDPWDRLELAGGGELVYATGVPLPLRNQPAGQELRQLASPRHGLDVSLRCVQGLVLAELVIDLGAGADLAAAARVRDGQLSHHCQLLRELLGLQMDGCPRLTAGRRAALHLSAPQPLPRALWSRGTGGLSAARALDPFSARADAHAAHPAGAASAGARWWTHPNPNPNPNSNPNPNPGTGRGGGTAAKPDPTPNRTPNLSLALTLP